MAFEWYVKRGTEQSGPITQHEFDKLREHLQQTDLLWRTDWQEWRPYRAAPTPDEAVSDQPAASLAPDELLQHLIARDLVARGIEPGKRRQYQYARVIEELMRSVIADIAPHPHWPAVLRERFNHAAALVEEFTDVCNVGFWQREPQPDVRDRLTALWSHLDLKSEVHSQEPLYLDNDGLSDIGHSYLLQDARSDEFEHLLVDALAAAEIFRFGEMVRKDVLESEATLRSSWRLIPRLSRHPDQSARKSAELFARMVEAYRALQHPQTNLDRCKELFESTAAEGADWDPALLIILRARV